jgi:hypothetical protein
LNLFVAPQKNFFADIVHDVNNYRKKKGAVSMAKPEKTSHFRTDPGKCPNKNAAAGKTAGNMCGEGTLPKKKHLTNP